MPEKILFVDDEAIILESLASMLGRRYSVLVALSGAEALQTMRDHPDIDVVVSDVNMPGMSGIEFLRKAAIANPKATRMMLTAATDRKTAEMAVNENHVFHYLLKPCDPPTLIEALEAAIELRNLASRLDQIKAALRKSA